MKPEEYILKRLSGDSDRVIAEEAIGKLLKEQMVLEHSSSRKISDRMCIEKELVKRERQIHDLDFLEESKKKMFVMKLFHHLHLHCRETLAYRETKKKRIRIRKCRVCGQWQENISGKKFPYLVAFVPAILGFALIPLNLPFQFSILIYGIGYTIWFAHFWSNMEFNRKKIIE